MAKRRAKGLGDTIENVLQATGIDKLAKFVLGEDCGCDERKAKLNELFPYSRKPLCLIENEYETLQSILPNIKEGVTPLEQMALLKVYNRVFQDNQQPTSCGSCWRDIITKLNKVYETYE
jgi:hypothetical protein